MSAPSTAVTAKNQFVQGTNGVRYAYRRLGTASSSVPPLVLLQHFRGNLDNWDPAFVDALSAGREVILFDNAGVGLSSGTVPSTVAQMARDAIAFLEALNVKQADLLGFSLGGFIAQELALIRPALVRRLVLAGTGPKGAPGMYGWRQDIADHALHPEPAGRICSTSSSPIPRPARPRASSSSAASCSAAWIATSPARWPPAMRSTTRSWTGAFPIMASFSV
ncbi:alpha/beta fold hydrolase [Cystobacter fuscus]